MVTGRSLVALCCVLAACEAPPVQWTDIAELSPTGTVPPSPVLAWTAAAPVLASAPLPPTLPDTTGACSGSLRFARGLGVASKVVNPPEAVAQWFAVWWQPREQGRVALMSSRSGADGGRSWTAPEVVDGRDAGTLGCVRAAPSVAVDGDAEYAHYSYWMAPTDGAGVFFTHWMRSDGLFHAPVAVVYGDRPVATSVAAEGDVVAVVFEDPNADGAIGLALSRTAGHMFEHREQVLRAHSRAAHPVVAVRGKRLAIAWQVDGGSATQWRYRLATLMPPAK